MPAVEATTPPRSLPPIPPPPSTETTHAEPSRDPGWWRRRVAPFERSSWRHAGVQIANTVIPALVLLAAMIATCRDHYGITLLLSIPAAGFFVRLFILQHDCGHGSFVPSAIGNHLLGCFLGVFTITPYFAWRLNHATHHAWSGKLDRRVPGAEFYTMTVEEYARLSPRRRLLYRIYRSPWLLLGIGGMFAFVLDNRRFSSVSGRSRLRDRLSVWLTNAAIVALAWAVGPSRYALVYAPLVILAGTPAVVLFYVQHLFEIAYFARDSRWKHFDAAVTGSSLFKLPKVLAFFTGSIGYHHIHHLSPRVPNYALVECHRELESSIDPPVLHLADVPRLLRLALWDEARGKLVSFKDSGVS
ncbi:MAG TPA: fatty acid desaturase [Labilithrix sp.]|nr:fatty acid desaturase [Labilithrix sp.]